MENNHRLMQYVTADKPPPQDLLNTATNGGGSLREMMGFIYLDAKRGEPACRVVSVEAGLRISIESGA